MQGSKRTQLLWNLCLAVVLYSGACTIPSANRAVSSRFGGSYHIGPNPSKTVHPPVHPLATEQSPYEQRGSNRLEISTDLMLVHQAHRGEVNSLTVSTDGSVAYSGGQDGSIVRSQSLLTERAENFGREISSVRAIQSEVVLGSEKPILALALSPDEKLLAFSQFSTVGIVDLETREIRNILTQVKGRILSLAWDPRQELIALGTATGDAYVWNLERGPRAGQDSTLATEEYSVGSSPVTKLLFHPSGRAFFASLRDGGVSLWRLIRTERELGLRDEQIQIEKKLRGQTGSRFSAVGGGLEDMWLNADASVIYASVSDGYLYRWRVRGLRTVERYLVGIDSVFSINGMTISNTGSEPVRLILTTGRGQRIKFWCDNERLFSAPPSTPGVTVVKSSKPDESEEEALFEHSETSLAELKALLSESDESSKPSANNSSDELGSGKKKEVAGLLATSALLRDPVSLLEVGRTRPLLWAAGKTGKLLSFDAQLLKGDPSWDAQVKFCKEAQS